MRIVFYRYGNICEADVLQIFEKTEIEVLEDQFEIQNKFVSSELKIQNLAEMLVGNLKNGKIDFIFSFSEKPL